jgi:hypothetical protein
MTEIQTPVENLRPQKEIVVVNGVEVAFPGKGTGARYVWDLCQHAVANGESSTYVVETAAANTTMSKPSINSQITYFRKATGLELSRRVNTEKAEAQAAKRKEREEKAAKRLVDSADKRVERIAALQKRIAADTVKLTELEAEEAKFQAGEAAPEAEHDQDAE